MNLLKSKQGSITTGTVNSAILGIILLVVLFLLYAELMPEAMDAGDALNESGVPLGSLFVSGGVVFLIIMAALIILVVKAFLKGGK